MTTTLEDIRFINSVIQWLSEFPSSPIVSNSTPSDLATPAKLFELFQILFYEEDLVNIPKEGNLSDAFNQNCEISLDNLVLNVPLALELQITYLEIILQNHYNNQKRRLISLKRTNDFTILLNSINLFKLAIFKDIGSIFNLSKLLLTIGTFSSKMSTFGLTSIQFLSDLDKIPIMDYLDVSIKELIDNTEDKDIDYPSISHLNLLGENSEYYSGIGSSIQDTSSNDKIDYSYIDEDYINSLIWENNLFDSLIFNIAMNT